MIYDWENGLGTATVKDKNGQRIYRVRWCDTETGWAVQVPVCRLGAAYAPGGELRTTRHKYPAPLEIIFDEPKGTK